MSIFDENRRQCSRCRKMISTYQSSPCDSQTCVPYEEQQGMLQSCDGMNALNDISDKKVDVDKYLEKVRIVNPHKETSIMLHAKATEILKNTVGEWIKYGDAANLFEQVDHARALTIAANYLDEIRGK